MTDIHTTSVRLRGFLLRVASALLGFAAVLEAAASAAPATIYNRGELAIPTHDSGALYMAPGHTVRCRAWFSEKRAGKIGCVSRDMFSIRELGLPSVGGEPIGLSSEPDGTLWVSEFGSRKIARVSLDESVREFSLSPAFGAPLAIVVGAGPYIWFTNTSPSGLARGKRNGSFTSVGPGDASGSLATYPTAGYVWFAEEKKARVGRIDYSLKVQLFNLVASDTASNPPDDFLVPDIAVASDQTIWFTETYVPALKGAAIGRLTTDGKVSYFKIPTADCQPSGILWDGSGVWFTEYKSSKIGHLDNSGKIQEYKTPTPHAGPLGLTEDDQGILWFVERAANKLGWFQLRPLRLIPAARPTKH